MRKILTILAFMLLSSNLRSEESAINQGVGFGFQLNQYQDNFGFGLSLNSPYLFGDNLTFRLKSNVMFNEVIQDQETTWLPYFNVSFGAAGVGGMVTKNIRLYGEGGILLIIPSEEFSSNSTEFGGYGLFGFEFFMNPFTNYFIEIGGVGTGAKADKIPFSPIYSNGLSISTGFRMNL